MDIVKYELLLILIILRKFIADLNIVYVFFNFNSSIEN